MRKPQIVLLVIVIICFLSACEQSETNSDANFAVFQNESSKSQTIDYPETSQEKDYTTENSESTVTNQFTQKDESIQIDIPTQPSKPIDSNNSINDNNDNDKNFVEELVGINKLRVDYNLGTCRNLSGNVSVILFFMDDFESGWTADEITNFTNNEVTPGLAFLEKEAKSYGVELDLSIKQRLYKAFLVAKW